MMAGCGAPRDNRIQIRYTAWGNPEQIALEKQFCDRFNRENPDVQVNFFQVPNSTYFLKAMVMMASRTAPDVLRIDHYNYPALAKRDYFYDMTPLLAKDPGFKESDFFAPAMQENRFNGHIYGLNVLFGGVMIYYNKSLVRQAGLEDPYELWKRGEWTWDRFRSHAKAMAKMDERGKPVRFGFNVPSFPMYASIIWGFGGDLLSKDGKKSLVDQPGTIKALQFLADMRFEDHSCPTPAQSANSQFTFESGKIGMEFNWMGMSPRYRTLIKDFEWDVCPVPMGPEGGSTCVKGNHLVIYKESRHPEAAYRFIRFMTSPEIERELYIVNRRSMPTRRALAYSEDYLKTDKPPFHNDVFVKSIENGRVLPITDRWNEWNSVYNSEIDNLFSGRERDAGVVLRRAAKKINDVLSEEEGY